MSKIISEMEEELNKPLVIIVESKFDVGFDVKDILVNEGYKDCT